MGGSGGGGDDLATSRPRASPPSGSAVIASWRHRECPGTGGQLHRRFSLYCPSHTSAWTKDVTATEAAALVRAFITQALDGDGETS
ncbi:hypothetical protein ACFPH6_05365 [Streptomyces xiangluensis]|uniref:Uncharacterized protein n=1 Tax=Streptomyces xiangluensis TaxID=2665720 RepID=A0ABV8YLD9_9ACTN